MDFERLTRKMLSSWVCTKRPVVAPEYTYGRGLFKLQKKAGINVFFSFFLFFFSGRGGYHSCEINFLGRFPLIVMAHSLQLKISQNKKTN